MTFVKMLLSWKPFLLLGFGLCFLQVSSENIHDVPVINTPGSVKIICLLDLHESTSVTDINECNNANPEVLQMAFVSLWKINNILNQTNADIGISVYDTCGSQERAIRILSSVIGGDTKIGGVISYTSPVVTSAISGVLRHLHLLHIDISDDVTSCRDDVNCISISLASRAKAEAVQELTKSLNWTYTTTLSLSNIRASAEEQLFANLVSDDVCLTGRHVVSELRDVTQAISSSTAHGIVLFTGDLDLTSTSSFELPDQSSLIVVSKDFSGLQTQLDYVRFADKPVFFQGFNEYLKTITDNNIIQWLLNTRFFQNICVASGGNPFMLIRTCIPTQSTPGALAISDAVALMGNSIKEAIGSCFDFDVLSCPAVSMTLTSLSVQNVSQHTQRAGDQERLLVEKDTVVTLTAYTPWPLNLTEIHTQHGSFELPSTMPGTFYNSHCQGLCSECSICKPSLTSSERLVLQEGTVYFVGVFPIHTTSSGMTCADPNIPGFQAAQAFTSAVDQLNSTGLTKDLPAGISIGWAMFDSCGDPGWFERKQEEIESCMYFYKDANEKSISLQPSRTIAYVNLGSPGSFAQSPKLTASVSSLGVGINGDSIKVYAETVMASLVKLRWTYTSVIYSDDELSMNILDHMKKSSSKESICFERMVKVSESVNTKSIIANVAEETGTVLILTNTSLTKDILTKMEHGSKIYRMVFFPWNVDVLRTVNISSIVKDIVIIWPKPDSTANNGASISGNPWFEGFQNIPGTATGSDFFAGQEMAESSMIVEAVNTLASQINRAYTGLCGEGNGVCSKFVDFHNIQNYIESTMSSTITRYDISRLKFDSGVLTAEKIGSVTPRSEVRLILDGTVIQPAASECTGWCPRCRQCQTKSSPSPSALYLPGDLLLAGVLPLSDSGEEGLMCGSLSTSLESEQMVEAFMFAVETHRKRYPYLLPNVEVGGLVVDSCSDISVAVQKVVNFETCTTTMDINSLVPPRPAQTLGYVIHAGSDEVQQLEQSISAVDKLSVSTVMGNSKRTMDSHLAAEYEAFSEISAIVQTLSYLNWTQVVLVISDTSAYRSKSNLFYEQASLKQICVTKFLRFNGTILSSLQYATSQLTLTGFVPVVVVASKADTARLFEDNGITRVPRPWLLSTSGADWSALGEVPVPAGTIFLDRKGKLSSEFADFYSRMAVHRNSSVWWRQYWEEKLRCSMEEDPSRPTCPRTIATRKTLPNQQATRVIISVDILLHAIHNQYVAQCVEKNGLCRRFAEEGIDKIPLTAKAVTFEFEDEIIKFGQTGLLVSSYDLISVHKQGFVIAGSWMNGHLHVDMTKFYNKDGQLNSSSTRCVENCVCLNDVTTSNSFTSTEAIYWETSGIFNGELWATIIVAIAAAGAFVTVILMFYVMYKVCTGALAKRYVGLGLLLLVGVMLLYLAVLPFVFTPSERVCALRYFAPGLTYCLCFATILVKMTSIRDYKLIGLGGEVSNLNQFMSVFFITSVQIAVGVQYWVLKGPFITVKDDGIKTVYACAFQRSEFLVYLVYVMFVLVLSSIYGISVRKEQKNMGEARLLLTSSWLCCVLWISWIVVLMFLDMSLSEPIISAGIMACATVMLTVIFIPKMHLVARLKYNVSKQSHFMQNGHKIDPDFMFERPYSLPGTLTSSYSSVKTYPRSIEHFDSSLSY